MMRRTVMLMAICLVASTTGYVFSADEHAEQQALLKSIGAAKVTLQQGLTAAEPQGQPISGKFEVEDGKLQLSVYTGKGSQFSEVLVDYVTGKIAKSEPITDADDLKDAKSQSAASARIDHRSRSPVLPHQVTARRPLILQLRTSGAQHLQRHAF